MVYLLILILTCLELQKECSEVYNTSRHTRGSASNLNKIRFKMIIFIH